MKIVAHRINTIEQLKSLPTDIGCEIDIRANGSNLILNHEPYQNGDLLIDYLDNYKHGYLILNVKEAGIENDILQIVRSRGINSFFLLDVEFPYLYKASRLGERNIAVRFSEDEPIELVEKYSTMIDWVWIDTISRLPIDSNNQMILNRLKSCLVCPERWGRPHEILNYRIQMKNLGFSPDAVMTSLDYVNLWQKVL